MSLSLFSPLSSQTFWSFFFCHYYALTIPHCILSTSTIPPYEILIPTKVLRIAASSHSSYFKSLLADAPNYLKCTVASRACFWCFYLSTSTALHFSSNFFLITLIGADLSPFPASRNFLSLQKIISLLVLKSLSFAT